MNNIEKTQENMIAWMALKTLMNSDNTLDFPFDEEITKKDLVELILCNQEISNQCLYLNNLNANLKVKLLKNILDNKKLTIRYINNSHSISNSEYKTLLYHIINNNDIELLNSFNIRQRKKFFNKAFIEGLNFSKSMAEKYDSLLVLIELTK